MTGKWITPDFKQVLSLPRSDIPDERGRRGGNVSLLNRVPNATDAMDRDWAELWLADEEFDSAVDVLPDDAELNTKIDKASAIVLS